MTALTPEEIAAGWREHDGGPCPVHPQAPTLVRYPADWPGDIGRTPNAARDRDWDEVLAYRIIEAHGEDAKPADPYDALTWRRDADGTEYALVEHDGSDKFPEWVREDDWIRVLYGDRWLLHGGLIKWFPGGRIAFHLRRRSPVCPECGQPLPEGKP